MRLASVSARLFAEEQWQKDIHHNMRSAREGAQRGTPPNGFASYGAHPNGLLNVVLDTLDAAKAEDVVVIDLRGKTSIGDQMVIASGRSQRHV
ncbi:MAG TPA: RsfS/YbeB/iojap family protein, partial [Methyloceanibacter sp.]|nr:RsfS/YbeB/iojap family protein [Methyloceanibacter sp.]